MATAWRLNDGGIPYKVWSVMSHVCSFDSIVRIAGVAEGYSDARQGRWKLPKDFACTGAGGLLCNE